MAERAWRVAIVDSGLDPRSAIAPLSSRRFVDDSQTVRVCELDGDCTGHGTAVAEIIGSASPSAEMIVAQVIEDAKGATPAAVAAAIHWALENESNLIHLSLGVPHDRQVLSAAVAVAIEAGVTVVAATPARGSTPFPAAYPGVLRATGDARCRVDEVSILGQLGADVTFGGCAIFQPSTGKVMRGASIGAAYVTRFIVSRVQPRGVAAQLAHLAKYQGRERHSQLIAPVTAAVTPAQAGAHLVD